MPLLLVITAFLPESKAQQNRPDVQFIQQFKALQQNLPRERVYLHTDRQWYMYGDRIWFSVYLTAGSMNAPSLLSRVVYVELYSPDGDLVDRIAIKNEEGRGRGSFPITYEEQAGNYRLKAYTAWSLNFGETYGFSRDIPVYLEENIPETDPETEFDVGFYPEGGDLIAGIESRVGFKAVNQSGLGKSINGVVYNRDDDEEVAVIESEHLGMGVFTLTPGEGERYYAEIDGKRFNLPPVRAEGVVLQVSENEHDQYFLRVRSSGAVTNSSLLVFGHVRGEIYLATSVDIFDGSGFTVAPKNMFPTGPVHFTVLGNGGAPLSERLAFNINPTDTIASTLSADQDSYQQREEVNLTLTVKDAEGETANGTASVTVFDDRLHEYQSEASNIETKLLLESDVAGHIENPGYYFSRDEERKRAADLLMLTQGWRAFDMDNVRPVEEIELASLPEEGITVEGQIQGGWSGRGLPGATVVFSLGSDHEEMQIIETDDEGHFFIPDLDVTGSKPMSIRANNSDGGDNVIIRLSEPYSHLPIDTTHISQVDFSPLAIGDTTGDDSADDLTARAESTQAQVEDFADVQMRGELDEVVVSAEKETVDESERDLRAREAGSQRIDLDERPALRNLQVENIVNQIPGVSANPAVGVLIRTGGTSFSGRPSPLILLDGIQTSWDVVKNLPPNDIKTINVFRRATELAAYGTRGAGGVLSVRTRTGSSVSGSEEPKRGFKNAFVEGYQTPTRFYSPRYGLNVPKDLEQKDTRITMHWEPEISMDDGEATIQFWTNDIPSRYRVVVEGITDFGIPFSETLVYDVN
ncbi:MAG: hypothetical protein GVY08_12395 [Bacteroidetes bacterium]|nr:hypothetical protein [Bacteroidota bacterium]